MLTPLFNSDRFLSGSVFFNNKFLLCFLHNRLLRGLLRNLDRLFDFRCFIFDLGHHDRLLEHVGRFLFVAIQFVLIFDQFFEVLLLVDFRVPGVELRALGFLANDTLSIAETQVAVDAVVGLRLQVLVRVKVVPADALLWVVH